jgi:hypothetical protein
MREAKEKPRLPPVRAAALRLEMAQGRVNAITCSGGIVGTAALEDAIFERDSQRNALRVAVEEATGMDVAALVRVLEI